ncbi:MAG TPA: cell division protein DivIVA, partial [Lactobacillus acetotolerans]|nr:cell division protein DivIVA [Lactobacillus acetotolerans]
ALDRYFHTDRFYPPDGSEPIPSASEDDIDGVDSDDSDDVDSVDEPKPMTGDSPSHETLNAKP